MIAKIFFVMLIVFNLSYSLSILNNNIYANNNEKSIMLEALKNRDDQKVIMLINKGFDINEPLNDIEDTALMMAAKKNNYELIVKLIKKGANIDFKNKLGDTTLYYSIDNAKIVKELIRNKANVNEKINGFGTVLHIASARNNINIIKELIKAEANIEAKDDEGNTPLITASIYGSEEAVSILMRFGANIDAKNIKGYSALAYAILRRNGIIDEYGRKESNWQNDYINKFHIIEKFLEHCGARLPLEMELAYQASQRNIENVKLLIQKGANINNNNWIGLNALHWAAYNGDIQMIDLLIGAGTNIDLKDSRQGDTALNIAINANSAPIH